MPSRRAPVESDVRPATILGPVPSHWELIILAIALVLLFGSKRVPEIARSLGRGVRELKETVSEADPRQDLKRALEDDKPDESRDEGRSPS
jgi:sec-independent protein translocase protein TatA